MGSILSSIWPEGLLFWLFCGLSGFIALICLAVSISSAMYLIAELAEEYPTLAGVILKRYILRTVFVLHLLLWMDGLPSYPVTVGVLCHAAYYITLKTFPFVKLKSINTVLCLGAFVWSHWVWFSYFSDLNQNQRIGSQSRSSARVDMLHIIGFFLVLVWVVPIGIFLSMSISDNVLPDIMGQAGSTHSSSNSSGDLPRGGGQSTSATPKKGNLFKTVYDFMHNTFDRVVDAVVKRGGTEDQYREAAYSTSNDQSGNYMSTSSGDYTTSPYDQFASSRTQINVPIPQMGASSAGFSSLSQRRKDT